MWLLHLSFYLFLSFYLCLSLLSLSLFWSPLCPSVCPSVSVCLSMSLSIAVYCCSTSVLCVICACVSVCLRQLAIHLLQRPHPFPPRVIRPNGRKNGEGGVRTRGEMRRGDY